MTALLCNKFSINRDSVEPDEFFDKINFAKLNGLLRYEFYDEVYSYNYINIAYSSFFERLSNHINNSTEKLRKGKKSF